MRWALAVLKEKVRLAGIGFSSGALGSGGTKTGTGSDCGGAVSFTRDFFGLFVDGPSDFFVEVIAGEFDAERLEERVAGMMDCNTCNLTPNMQGWRKPSRVLISHV